MNEVIQLGFYIQLDDENGRQYKYHCDFDPTRKKATAAGPIDNRSSSRRWFSVDAKSIYDAREKLATEIGLPGFFR